MTRSVMTLASQRAENAAPPSIERTARANSLPTLFCFSHLRWNFVFQRPQHILIRAAKHYQVFFIEEPVWEDMAEPTLRIEPQPQGVTVVVPILPQTLRDPARMWNAVRVLVDGLLGKHRQSEVIHWYYTPMAMHFTGHLKADLTVYDCMDELSAFRGASPDLQVCEKMLFERADLVFTGGMSLYEAKRSQHHSVYAFPSSVDTAHFAKARLSDIKEPDDQAAIPHPRVGFFGVIDERMDLELVAKLAALRPDLHLVFLGPVVKIDPASLPQAGNIHWLGGKDYKQLPNYLAGWSAAIMPFALNESTKFISPTKTPEFLAAGVPVVSTPIADVIRPYGTEKLVEISATAEEMAAAIDVVLARPRDPWLAAVDCRLAATSWDKTWSEMNQAMTERLYPKTILSSELPSLLEAARV